MNGHSVAFDPIAFDAQGMSRDTFVVEAGEAEGIVTADFDLQTLRAVGEREVWGAAFRRPTADRSLTGGDPGEPLVRVDRGGRRWPKRRR